MNKLRVPKPNNLKETILHSYLNFITRHAKKSYAIYIRPRMVSQVRTNLNNPMQKITSLPQINDVFNIKTKDNRIPFPINSLEKEYYLRKTKFSIQTFSNTCITTKIRKKSN